MDLLKNLRSLWLADNRLTALPASLKNLSLLALLDLRGNRLPIPDEILERIYDPPAILSAYFDGKT